MKPFVIALALVLLVSVVSAQKKHSAKITEKQATKVALDHVKGGAIKSAELEKESGKLIWSFDVKTDSGISEVWVDAVTGKYIKTEKESVANESDEAMTEKAEKAALKKVPGEIVKQDSKEKDGKQVYSFEIKNKAGKVFEVDVDGKTGKVLSTEEEKAKPDDDKDDDDDD